MRDHDDASLPLTRPLSLGKYGGNNTQRLVPVVQLVVACNMSDMALVECSGLTQKCMTITVSGFCILKQEAAVVLASMSSGVKSGHICQRAQCKRLDDVRCQFLRQRA